MNVNESSIARESDDVLPTLAGPEIGVASTKAFTCQLTVLAALAIHIGRQRGVIDEAKESELVRSLVEVPRLISEVLAHEEEIDRISHSLSQARDVLYLGRGMSFPIAMEGALKLKEISYIHSRSNRNRRAKLIGNADPFGFIQRNHFFILVKFFESGDGKEIDSDNFQ